jgi:glycine/D-amino acid oxidase-like deaminating enzyme
LKDFLIVGQGIAGSLLYHSLTKAGAECIVIDDNKLNSASRVAAGLVNPVTGRRLVKSWMIDQLLPVIAGQYSEIEKDYQRNLLYETGLTWHLPATDIVQAFEKRLATQTDFVYESNLEDSRSYFNFPFSAADIRPCFIVDVQLLLGLIRKKIADVGNLVTEAFEYEFLKVENNSIRYKNIHAAKIVFCEGGAGIHNPWFRRLPYSINKGEALILSIDNLPRTTIYKFRQTLVPLPCTDNLWWYGSNYTWEFQDDSPTKQYAHAAERELKSWLKLPFTVIDHKAAIRYATVERRPFVGFHPQYLNVGIFNGWGTKGCSLIPYFADQFAQSITGSKATIDPEADIKRFTKLLVSQSR